MDQIFITLTIISFNFRSTKEVRFVRLSLHGGVEETHGDRDGLDHPPENVGAAYPVPGQQRYVHGLTLIQFDTAFDCNYEIIIKKIMFDSLCMIFFLFFTEMTKTAERYERILHNSEETSFNVCI